MGLDGEEKRHGKSGIERESDQDFLKDGNK